MSKTVKDNSVTDAGFNELQETCTKLSLKGYFQTRHQFTAVCVTGLKEHARITFTRLVISFFSTFNSHGLALI